MSQEAAAPLALFLRLKEGVAIKKLDLQAGTSTAEATNLAAGEDCRDALTVFSVGGTWAAFASTDSVYVVDALTGELVQRFAEPKVQDLQLSPKGTFLVTHRPHDPKTEQGNMAVFKVDDGTEIFRAVQAVWPSLQWSADEKFVCRQLQQRLMVHDGSMTSTDTISKLELSFPRGKEASVAASPSGAIPFVAVFRPQSKTGQAGCSVFRLPHLADALVTQTFGRGDSAKMEWSKSGSAVTVVVHSATDTSHQSYYGTTTLWVVHAKDRVAKQIRLTEGESVHDVAWSPTADEFILVHGIMPRNKATLYSANGEPIYQFGEGPRNVIKWAPNGKLFALGGTGGLAGDFQFYDRTAVGKKSAPVVTAQKGSLVSGSGGASASTVTLGSSDGKLGYFSEKSSTQVWSPCSRYLLCCNVFRILRQDNRFVVWKHNGERVMEEKFPGELHGCDWVPIPATAYPERPPSPTKQTASCETVKPKTYRPPGAPSAAAAMLARPSSTGVGGGVVKAKPTGPVGGAVVEKKKRRR